MDLEANKTAISIFLTSLGMFVGWILLAVKDTKKRRKEREEEREKERQKMEKLAYERGLHDSVHVELKTDVVAAHEKLRAHDSEIAELKKSDAAHAEVHNAILNQMEHMNKTIDTIHRVIMGNKNV